MKNRAAFFSISDRQLHEKLKSLLPGLFPARTFAFLDDTFDVEPWRPGGKRDLDPTSRLLWKWIPMNQKAPEIAQALSENDCVLVFEFGRDAYHYAIRHQDCSETLHFHEALVEMRIIEQDIYPPEYLLLKPGDPRLQRADDEYFKNRKQTRHYLTAPDIDTQLDEAVAIIRQRISQRAQGRQRVSA